MVLSLFIEGREWLEGWGMFDGQFRPRFKSGLRWELRDQDGKIIKEGVMP